MFAFRCGCKMFMTSKSLDDFSYIPSDIIHFYQQNLILSDARVSFFVDEFIIKISFDLVYVFL